MSGTGNINLSYNDALREDLLAKKSRVGYILETLETKVRELRSQLSQKEDEAENLKLAESVILEFLTSSEESIAKLGFLLNLVLQYVFPDLEFILKTQKDDEGIISGIQFLVSDGKEIRPVYDYYGASVVEILFFSLNMLLAILFGGSRILVMDEPLKSLSQENWEKVVELASSICQRYGIQLIITTHHGCDALRLLDNIFVYTIENGPSGATILRRPGEDS
jgi:DNA repair exonuclease SbcCD ATPase subunit